jgi:hypothetical protein
MVLMPDDASAFDETSLFLLASLSAVARML